MVSSVQRQQGQRQQPSDNPAHKRNENLNFSSADIHSTSFKTSYVMQYSREYIKFKHIFIRKGEQKATKSTQETQEIW